MLATCRSGPELSQIAYPSSDLNRFYENFSYELFLVPLSNKEKKRIADKSGLSLTPTQIQNAPTPGWIVMDDARITMETRFRNLTQKAKETLYSCKLLGVAGISLMTQSRVKNVLKKIFDRQNVHLPDILAELVENNFLETSDNDDLIQPEIAYLVKVVSYPRKHPKEDFHLLGQMLKETADTQGLFSLAITTAQRLRELNVALDYLREARNTKENFYEAWHSEGYTYYIMSKTSNQPELLWGAILAYQKAIEIKSDYHIAWNDLGIVYKELGQYEKAIEAYDKALETDTEPHKSWYNKGLARCMMEQSEQYKLAVEDFKKAVEIKPNYHQAWENLAYTFIILEQYDEALEAIQEAHQLDLDNIKYWATLGIALSYLEREDAILWLCKAWRAWGSVYTPTADIVNKKLEEAFARLGISPANCIN